MDVDAVSDGRRTFIGGIMEHIEEAGVHSAIRPASAAALHQPGALEQIRNGTRSLAAELGVIG
jgi:carbamoyl-phosphate synthase large subunit